MGIKEFLSQYVETEPGAIVDSNGKEIGTHDGAIFYTIGQRHGLNVGGGLPYYVTQKDMDKNIIYVTTNLNDASLWFGSVSITDLHWLNDSPKSNKSYKAQLRYRGPLVNCKIQIEGGIAMLALKDQQRGLAAGQSAVIYDKDRIVGGGIISQTNVKK